MKPYDVVFLDLDDTLMDFSLTEDFAIEASFREAGRPLTSGEIEAYEVINHALWASLERGEIDLGFLKVERFRRFFAEANIGLDPVAFSARFSLWLGRGVFLLPEAEEICAYLAGKYRLVLVSNGIREVQHARLGASPLAPYFSGIAVSEEAGAGKPDPRIFEFARAKVGYPEKSGILMVGDSLSSDIRGGEAFGIDTCWYNPRGLPPPPGKGPTYSISALGELKNFL